MSVALNIAEGAGETAPAEKARLYRIARRSAEEVRAALRLIELMNHATAREVAPARHLTTRLTVLLLRLIDSMHQKRDKTENHE